MLWYYTDCNLITYYQVGDKVERYNLIYAKVQKPIMIFQRIQRKYFFFVLHFNIICSFDILR